MSVEVKEIIQDYVLIVFDIPQNQSKLRKLILKRIHDVGGLMHTASCYLMPYSEKAMALANEISVTGDCVVWRSQQLNPEKAKSLTIDYANHIMARCQLISQRFVQIKDYVEKEWFGRATLMIIKTKRMIDQLKKIAETFNPPWLPEKIAGFDKLLEQVISKKAG